MEKLEELNQKCKKCLEKKARSMERLEPMECQLCPIGEKVHQLEGEGWNNVDWNSSQWEQLYRH